MRKSKLDKIVEIQKRFEKAKEESERKYLELLSKILLSKGE